MDANDVWHGLMTEKRRISPPRCIIIGAGSRGNAYARAITESTCGVVKAIAEPINFKRAKFGKTFIWHRNVPKKGEEFLDWKHFLAYELNRRDRAAKGEDTEEGIDAAFICTLDEQHVEIIIALAPLNLHIMSEKPLATSLRDCLRIFKTLSPSTSESSQKAIFGIGHVLRYSPHNMMLRELVLQNKVIGDVLSVEHVEPVGWWHFAHSYVRGPWRKESSTAPSLLTKSCHDIDFILWLLCSNPSPKSAATPHLPLKITSSGHLSYFRKVRKPAAAGSATNCFECPIESSCKFSAKKIYVERHLRKGYTDWPVKIVNPEIEDWYRDQGLEVAEAKLTASLKEDYDAAADTPDKIDARPWFGRCVWEAANDVCDDQFVILTWDDEPTSSAISDPPETQHFIQDRRFAKTATFHMIAQTEAQCERRGRIYGTDGEISYDSRAIRVFDFATSTAQTYNPALRGGGHGGGDDGLAMQFIKAVDAVKNQGMEVDEAQKTFVGCTLEEVVRSHAVVFAAEEARMQEKVVFWKPWWEERLAALGMD